MTQEEKELLLKDLCARLRYGVICKMWGSKEENALEAKFTASDYASLESNSPYSLEYCKPYLRPMSSMTEEERKEWFKQSHVDYDCEFKPEPTLLIDYCYLSIDWLNAHHFDYRGLIEKGLALPVKENMYND